MDTKQKGLPADFLSLLAQENKRHGFPAGTMEALVQQEVGGNSKYLDDPTAYHYPLNAEGKRVAGHTGKVSTAFGPFGILESTGRDPGYGVKPLGDKQSLAEQARFASDYLAARIKQGGSMLAGLAGYGEGDRYAQQVKARLPVTSTPLPVVGRTADGATQLAANDPVGRRIDGTVQATSPMVALAGPEATQGAPAPVYVNAEAPRPAPEPLYAENNAWSQFIRSLSQGRGHMAPDEIQYGFTPMPMPVADIKRASGKVDFARFGGWGRRAA
jgi:hypothetical protein